MSPQLELEEIGVQVTGDTDDLRLAEVEERLDFAERLLTDSPPSANPLPRGVER
jgi:hypothetical protein